jgi:preprotein translocase subunit SecE
MNAQSVLNNKVVKYFREAKMELEKVSWPTRKDTIMYSSIVLGLSLTVAVLTGVLDLGLTKGLEFLISKIPA